MYIDWVFFLLTVITMYLLKNYASIFVIVDYDEDDEWKNNKTNVYNLENQYILDNVIARYVLLCIIVFHVTLTHVCLL